VKPKLCATQPTIFDRLEIGLTRAKPGAKMNAQFFYPVGKKERLGIYNQPGLNRLQLTTRKPMLR